jgi:hypothetical protein
MFDFTLLDHLRLTFGHIVYRHRAHAHIAYSRARWSRWLRAIEAVLMTGVAFATLSVAFGQGQPFATVAAILAGLALVTLLVHLTFDFDGSAQAHGVCASRLWYIREKYRSLLSDLSDGALALDAARNRRDGLMSELHGIYENAPPADYPAYQSAAKAILAAEESAMPDEEIDRFLPKSLQKTAKSPPAA